MLEELKKGEIIPQNNILLTEIVEKDFETNPFAHYLVYKINNEIVGFLYYSEIYERIEINQIEVEEKYRRKKIASKLLQNICNKEKNITLEVKIDNIPAINLYQKYHFKKVAIRKGYYQGIDGILMEKRAVDKNRKRD